MPSLRASGVREGNERRLGRNLLDKKQVEGQEINNKRKGI